MILRDLVDITLKTSSSFFFTSIILLRLSITIQSQVTFGSVPNCIDFRTLRDEWNFSFRSVIPSKYCCTLNRYFLFERSRGPPNVRPPGVHEPTIWNHWCIRHGKWAADIVIISIAIVTVIKKYISTRSCPKSRARGVCARPRGKQSDKHHHYDRRIRGDSIARSESAAQVCCFQTSRYSVVYEL
jgi:hypothetical protein